MGVLIRSAVGVALVFAGIAAPATLVEAQGVSTPGLTAAFLFSFVKFTKWPDETLRDGSAIVICVIGNEQVAEALIQITYNKAVDGHPIGIRRTELNRPVSDCHLIFASSLDKRAAQELVRAAARHPILTLSDYEDFARIGGVANFFIDGGRMRFAVNPDAADRARLRISSQLLSLARIVRDKPPSR